MRKDFNYLCHVNVEEWHKYKYMCLFPVEKLASEGLKAFGDKNGCYGHYSGCGNVSGVPQMFGRYNLEKDLDIVETFDTRSSGNVWEAAETFESNRLGWRLRSYENYLDIAEIIQYDKSPKWYKECRYWYIEYIPQSCKSRVMKNVCNKSHVCRRFGLSMFWSTFRFVDILTR